MTAFTVASPTSSPTATRRRTLLAPLSKRELKAAGSETKTARALLQDANDNACTLVPVDLRNQPHDISGDTTFSTEMHEMSCESQTRTHRYQYLLPPRYCLFAASPLAPSLPVRAVSTINPRRSQARSLVCAPSWWTRLRVVGRTDGLSCNLGRWWLATKQKFVDSGRYVRRSIGQGLAPPGASFLFCVYS